MFLSRYRAPKLKNFAAFAVATVVFATPSFGRARAFQNYCTKVDRLLSAPVEQIAFRTPSKLPLENSRPLVLAHAIVVRTSPPQGGVGDANIGKVDVWYDAGIRDAFAALAVVSASGDRVDKRDAAIDSADPAHVSVGVNPLTPGKYTVRYRALSADGHMVSGAWDFEVH
jgi:hypothetical protein